MAFGGFDRAPIQGAPYSATITNESIQTLADGNRIVQTSTGTTARDSQGRTRHDTALPAIGNLSAANAPRLIFLQDPVAQTSYTLNLTDKTAQKCRYFSAMAGGAPGMGPVTMKFGEVSGPRPMLETSTFKRPHRNRECSSQKHVEVTDGHVNQGGPEPGVSMFVQKHLDEQAQASTRGPRFSDYGRCPRKRRAHDPYDPRRPNRNERPIAIVSEIWTSPDLKTVVFSKTHRPPHG